MMLWNAGDLVDKARKIMSDAPTITSTEGLKSLVLAHRALHLHISLLLTTEANLTKSNQIKLSKSQATRVASLSAPLPVFHLSQHRPQTT
ncbi:unnamed protein product [Chrysoparadoxa australica]